MPGWVNWWAAMTAASVSGTMARVTCRRCRIFLCSSLEALTHILGPFSSCTLRVMLSDCSTLSPTLITTQSRSCTCSDRSTAILVASALYTVSSDSSALCTLTSDISMPSTVCPSDTRVEAMRRPNLPRPITPISSFFSAIITSLTVRPRPGRPATRWEAGPLPHCRPFLTAGSAPP